MLRDAIKLNMKSAISWHFMAMMHKEEGNYSQSLSAYLQAYKHNPKNYNVIRDLSYLQLFLRQFNSFTEYSKKALDSRPDLAVNWVTYAFANTMNENYEASISLLNSCQKSTIKKNELNEILLFQGLMLTKQKKYEEATTFLIEKSNVIIDKTLLFENIVKNASLAGKAPNMKDVALDYLTNLFKINGENVNYFIWYFNLMIEGLNATKYNDLLSIQEDSKHLQGLYTELTNLQQKYKSRILSRLELAFSTGYKFKEVLNDYFIKNITLNLPSFFKNIKFIYQFQQYKVKIIEELIVQYLESIKSSNSIQIGDKVFDIAAHLIWVYYFAAQHYNYLGELEKALELINKAIDLTPTVIEFFMCKAKILKHGLMMKESSTAYEKARNLDFGDMYLNVKYGKTFARCADIKASLEVMRCYIKDYFTEENIEYYQYMWYENEIANAYLQNGKILHSYWLFKTLLKHFTIIYNEQSDFYNYCFRRFTVNDIYNTILFLNDIRQNKYVYKSMKMLDAILSYLKQIDENKAKELEKEGEEIQNEKWISYKYTSPKVLIEEIEKELYTFSRKVYHVIEEPYVQLVCMKMFMSKNKTLLSFKVLRYLSQNKNSYYYIEALKLFNSYYSQIHPTLDDRIKSIIDDTIKTEMSETEKLTAWNDDKHPVDKVMKLLNQKEMFNNRKENEETIYSICNTDKIILRKITNEYYHEMFSLVTLYSDVECKENLKMKLKEIMKLNVNENDIHYNLTVYDKV